MNFIEAIKIFRDISDLLQELQTDGTLKEVEEAIGAVGKHVQDPRVTKLFDKLKRLAPQKEAK
jgi:hypothetical protein